MERVENQYDCCPDPIITLNVNIHFTRRPMFALFTTAIPCIMLSLMTIIAFLLPPHNEAKIGVQLSVMLSLAVFMLLIGESLPPSDTVPLIGTYSSYICFYYLFYFFVKIYSIICIYNCSHVIVYRIQA